jgi:Ca2+-binding EF-hand superfamily protein
MFRLILSLPLGLLLLASAVDTRAEDDTRQQRILDELQQRFTQADTNHDGLLSREEAETGMPRVYKRYDAIDTDKKGALSLEDITGYLAQQRGKH